MWNTTSVSQKDGHCFVLWKPSIKVICLWLAWLYGNIENIVSAETAMYVADICIGEKSGVTFPITFMVLLN